MTRFALVFPAFLLACGYHTFDARDGGDAARLHVVLVRSVVPHAAASDEVVSGVRDELAREGLLAAGEGYPRVEVEVLRVDESSEGVAASSSGAALAPQARATETGVVARAWVVSSEGGEPARDTGDIRALDVASSDSASAARDAIVHEDTVRAVARRVGARLAKRILGLPVASDESMGRER